MYNSVVRYLDHITETDQVAIETEKRKVTYGEYRKASRKIGAYISKRIKKINQPVAVYIPKDERALEAYMGILYSGNYYCPIPYNSPRERAKQMIKILEDSYVLILSEEQEVLSEWGVNRDRVIFFDDAVKYESDDELDYGNLDEIIDCDPAYLLFTSGSTGKPKGVVISHRAIMDRINWMAEKFTIDESNVLANQAPFHFDASMPDIFLNIITKARLVIPDEKLYMFPLQLLQYLQSTEVNTLIWVPSALVNLTHRDIISKCLLEKLELVIFCGEVMHNKYLNIFRDLYPNTVFINMYGPTEAAYACTYYIVDRQFQDNEPLPIGMPCGNTDVFLVSDNEIKIDKEKIRCEGEICVRGSSIAQGYFKDIDNAAFELNMLNKEIFHRIYKTGDIGYYNERGELMYAGRKDAQIKHLGYRIELGEIETAVQSLTYIKYSCVLYDDKNDNIILFYESDNPECNRQYIVSGIKKIIPKYMYPGKFVKLPEMPFNINGKIDRKKLKNMIESDT